jgi:hypothetical protein
MSDPTDRDATVLRIPSAHPITESRVVDDATDVRTLIPGGAAINRPVLFANDRWDTKGHPDWTTKAGAQTVIDFTRVPAVWRSAVKEWCLLTIDPWLALRWAADDPIAESWPSAQEPVKLVTAQGNVKQLGLALQVLAGANMLELTADDWARAAVLLRQPQNRAEKLAGAELAAGTLRGRAQQLCSLWASRTILQRFDLLGSEPFDGQDTTLVFGVGHRPKLNQRRPHEDVGRCLGFVAWVFDHIAEDIVAHSAWWSDNTIPDGEAPTSQTEGYQAMTELLADIHGRTGQLPGSRNVTGSLTLAHSALGSLVGARDATEAYLWGRYAMRRFDAADLDEHASPCDLPIAELPLATGTGRGPWAPRLLRFMPELCFWQSALVYYAMFYVAATCGLRDKDLACLPLDCLSRQWQLRPDGATIEVVSMRGYKTKNRIAPQATSWKVNERLARIVGLLQELHRIHGLAPRANTQTGEALLFDSRLMTVQDRAAIRETLHLDLQWINWFTRGAARLHAAGVISDPLSDVTRLNSSQIRITAIQAYAARPLGNALAAAFGQWDTKNVAMGYHGDVYKIVHLADPADAMAFQHEHIGRVITRAARDIDDIRGRGVPRLERAIQRSGAAALSNPGPLSTGRLKNLGKRNANISLGPHTICVFQAEGALCGGHGSADFRLCRPYECRNSAMTRSHRASAELRRRLDGRGHPALDRSARKIAAAMPEVVEEFAQTSDDELVRLVADELDDYLNEALGLR